MIALKTKETAQKAPSAARKELVFISPELAAEWLAKSIGNRPMMKRQIDRLVREIKAGRWNPEASEIRLSDADRLIDGHHRLTAIVRSGIGVWQWVAFGCRLDTVSVIDTGVTRTNSGQRAMLGEENAKLKTSVLNAVSLMIAKQHVVLSKAEQDELGEQLGAETLTESIAWGHSCAAESFSSPAFVAGALAVLVKTWPESIDFARRVVSANGEKGEPSRELARWLVTSRSRGGLGVREEIAQRVASAYAAHSAGLERRYIRKASSALGSLRSAARLGWAKAFWESVRPETETE